MRIAFEASGRTYGYRRVRASIMIGADGHKPMDVSEREVRYAMRQGGMGLAAQDVRANGLPILATSITVPPIFH